jgi:putative transposase
MACEALETTKEGPVIAAFERLFAERGLPDAIRTDNGPPFASPNALFDLSKLSIWWLRLGIKIQRIKPGHPQDNGRHERMHLTLKKEATKPASFNFLQQQERFDRFIEVYNNQRPHQALNGAYPGELYTPSARVYYPPPEPDYPFHDRTVRVTRCGRICIGKRKISLSQVFAGQVIGIKEVDDKIWLVSFLNYDLGFFDHKEGRVEPAPNPFIPDNL